MGKFNEIRVQHVDESIWKQPTPTTETIEGCEELADNLFREIENRFGEKDARRIFSSCSKPWRISKHESRKSEVLSLYYNMKPWPNKLALARELAEKNKTRPREDRFGTGSTDVPTFHTYIRRAVAGFEKKKNKSNVDLLLLQMWLPNMKPKSKKRRPRRR